jgi:hypothetical protein
MNTVKVGDKKRHLDIPEGWKLVADGVVQPGDQLADIIRITWISAEDDEVGVSVKELTDGGGACIRTCGGQWAERDRW